MTFGSPAERHGNITVHIKNPFTSLKHMQLKKYLDKHSQ